MEKLELKHLSPYLPYGLKCIAIDDLCLQTAVDDTEIQHESGTIITIDYISNTICGYDIIEDKYKTTGFFDWYIFETIKPILHPLSDLTKEIEVNGKKFIPYIELLRECNFDVDNMSKEDLEYYYPREEELTEVYSRMYLEVAKLFEWHFNVFNLPEELFIDINTL